MGRKRKFGEESDFVSVRVPKSKRSEYRNAIKNFVEKKFEDESRSGKNTSKEKLNRVDLNGFRKFNDFIEEIQLSDKEKEQEDN